MKKGIFLILFFLLTVFSVSAGVLFFNFTGAHANHWAGEPKISTSILGLNAVGITNFDLFWEIGFGGRYSFEVDGKTIYTRDIKNYSGIVVNGMLGYGKDIFRERVGIVIGGGIMLDWHINNYYTEAEWGNITETSDYHKYKDLYVIFADHTNTSEHFMSLGLGFAPYFYIKLSDESTINIGGSLAWTPLAFDLTHNEDMKFNESQLQAELHIGGGFRF